ncbi:Alpha-methylacyl-CoA racemase [Planococcus halocryophilus Or1]|uniref:CoA transferase n=1 Tax=Planococcus halocryophilus TaxID=1215089 RepID=A0A1C7DV13_9BACL|nr:CaiB/BaiF CoA-transferase family protein [Planococcus halocryophilus]ANU15053.1 CoA transferase [Planococcus halocryophilus]EMF45735.1 Alpha-methylacyl-CoA racemase [Planococcus halocryophilus Or1]
MKDALKGVRILDVTYYLPGPYASMRLVDLGAEVIKIEPPEGDPARYMSGGHVHQANNRGKNIIRIDLKTTEGHMEMLELVKSADALIETFRPGVMKKLGLDYDSLKSLKPDLVYCSLSGYGQSGEMARLGSHDLNYMALSGALDQLKDASGRPIHPTNTFADFTGGLMATEQILAALLKKFRTGHGQYLDIALVEVMAEFLGNHDRYHAVGISENGIPEIGGTRVSYAIYETKDGRYITLGALEEKFWRNFCEFVGNPQWLEWGEKSLESLEHQEIVNFFKSKDWCEWYQLSLQVDACLAPVLTAHERHEHPFFMREK